MILRRCKCGVRLLSSESACPDCVKFGHTPKDCPKRVEVCTWSSGHGVRKPCEYVHGDCMPLKPPTRPVSIRTDGPQIRIVVPHGKYENVIFDAELVYTELDMHSEPLRIRDGWYPTGRSDDTLTLKLKDTRRTTEARHDDPHIVRDKHGARCQCKCPKCATPNYCNCAECPCNE